MKFLAYLASVLVIPAALAQEIQIPSVKVQTQQILTAVKKYSEAISCTDATPRASNIAAMVPYKNSDQRLDAKFAVIWFGDIGCLGGSGTSGARIAMVKVGAGDNFYVSAGESSPQIEDDLPRYVERVVGSTQDSIIVDVRDYGANDPNCCPSLRKRLTLRLTPKEGWVTVDSKNLPSVRQ